MDRTAPTALYRLYARGGQLLYVGIALDPERRMKQHAKDKPWWPFVLRQEVEWFPNRPQAETAELVAISAERPTHNYVGTLAVHVFMPVASASGRKGVRALKGVSIKLRATRGTERQAIRIDRELWDRFGDALPEDLDRSAAVRAFMGWYLRDRGVVLPKRP